MRLWAALLASLWLAGCASNVVTDYDAGAGFAEYQTWAFAGKQNEGQRDFLSLDASRVENAVASALERQSMEKVAEAEADLLVSYRVEDVERLDTTGFTYGFGWGRSPFGFGLSTAPPVREIREGKLVVELVDNDTDRVVWRGASKRYLNEDQSPERRRELIDEVVQDMFEQYPPQG